MKAICLAAGFGKRLFPLTEYTPKCLVTVKGLPLLGHWLNNLREYGFTKLLINTHYLAEKVKDYIEIYKKSHSGIDIKLIYEPQLLGTAGTVWNNSKFVGNDDCLIFNADVYTKLNLSSLYNTHLKRKMVVTMGIIEKNNVENCGLVEMKSDFTITKFEEKPKIPFSNLAYSGIQVINSQLFKLLPFDEIKHINYLNLCFGKDVWPMLHGKMTAYKIDCPLIDIGSMKSYKLANDI